MLSLKEILEDLSYSDLLKQSTPKRIERSKTVNGAPLNIRADGNDETRFFRFKSNPSTTGKRHQGFIKFIDYDRKQGSVSEGKMACHVDCDCEDFKYRYAYVDAAKNASSIGDKSLNKCINRPPNIMNPKKRIGLCKHLIRLKEYLIHKIKETQGNSLMEKLNNVGNNLPNGDIY